jgi:hypothetical protein
MNSMDGGDWVLLAVGAFIAVAALTRLMVSHRNQLLVRLRSEMEQERIKQQRAQKRQKK